MARINWKEEFEEADAERIALYHKQQKEELRKIIIGLALEMDVEKDLRNIATFIASYNDKRIAYYGNGCYKLENKKKAVLNND
ncbi:MAG: hypothetical protein ACI4D0_06580 [Lachnospira sp.]